MVGPLERTCRDDRLLALVTNMYIRYNVLGLVQEGKSYNSRSPGADMLG
jgi:hypothetical protein